MPPALDSRLIFDQLFIARTDVSPCTLLPAFKSASERGFVDLSAHVMHGGKVHGDVIDGGEVDTKL
jgi:hypothetical protein